MNNGGPRKDPNKESSGEVGKEQRLPLDEVSRLVELVRESGVGEVSVRQGELEVTVRAREPVWQEASAAPVFQAAPAPASEEPEGLRHVGEEIGENGRRIGLHEVRSPLVGTFYRAPAPGEDDYVKVGDRVREGQTLCIVEAMKLMNEIPADVSGEVVEVLADNAGGVQYDQPLFALQPDAE
jgi:acetyl-CoA carboxylase biotin carboxyl carrier protein